MKRDVDSVTQVEHVDMLVAAIRITLDCKANVLKRYIIYHSPLP